MTAAPARPAGRPRSAAAHRAILEAAAELLEADGYEQLSIQAVAARAGVGKQTVYRRWPSKGELVAAAVLDGALAIATPELRDTDDLAQDLDDWLAVRLAAWSSPREASLVRALAAAAASSETAAAELYARFTGPAHAALEARLLRARDAGRLRPDADVAAAADALMGGQLYLALARHDPLTADRARSLLRTVLHGVLAP